MKVVDPGGGDERVGYVAPLIRGLGLDIHRYTGVGPLMGGPQCHLSILRNGNVPCRYF